MSKSLAQEPEDWRMPLDLSKLGTLGGERLGAWLTEALKEVRWPPRLARDLRWAGPTRDLLHSCNEFCVRCRLHFRIDWARDHPSSTGSRLLRRLRDLVPGLRDDTYLIPAKLQQAFVSWMNHARA